MDSNYQTDQQCLDAVSKALVEFPGPFLDFARDCDVTDDPAGDFVSDTHSLARVHGGKWHEVAASRLCMADDVVRSAAGVIALKFFAHRAANSKYPTTRICRLTYSRRQRGVGTPAQPYALSRQQDLAEPPHPRLARRQWTPGHAC